MTNTQELIVLRAYRGRTIGEAYKALDKANNALKDRYELYFQKLLFESQAYDCKQILEELNQ